MTNEKMVSLIQQGNKDLLADLYEQNTGLLLKMVRRYSHLLPIEDLMQCAFFGIADAAELFDTSQGYLFMTYAQWYVKHEVISACIDAGSVRRGNGKIEIVRDVSMNETVSFADDENIEFQDTIPDANVNVEDSATDMIYCNYEKSELWKIVQKYMTSKDNEIIDQCFRQGLSVADIAKQEGKTVSVVQTEKNNAIRRLRHSRAVAEMKMKLDAKIYQGGYSSFINDGESIVEKIAIRKIQFDERMK